MNSPFSLQGKTVLITGASSGLGRHTALVCTRMGANVIITGRDAHRLQETYDQLSGDGHIQVRADLSQAADREHLVQVGQSINGLVHCAGKQKLCPIRQLSEQDMTDIYNVNFLAPVMLTQRLLQANAIAAQGSIIFLLSIAAHIGTRGVGPYSAMKAGLTGIIRCLALEQAKHKIRINGISPSAVETPIWQGGHTDVPKATPLLDAQKAKHPLGLGTPDDVANAVVYMLSDASRWVTGTSLVMDGGVVL